MTIKLKKADWQKIKEMLKREDRNISKIAKFYGVSRTAIYSYAFRRNWIKRKSKKREEKKGFWSKIFGK
jgi:Zn-dependent peptidase ImmA (M78 family)